MVIQIGNTFYQVDKELHLIKPPCKVLYKSEWCYYPLEHPSLWKSTKIIKKDVLEIRDTISQSAYYKMYTKDGLGVDSIFKVPFMPDGTCTIGAVLENKDNYFRITGQWKIKKLKRVAYTVIGEGTSTK